MIELGGVMAIGIFFVVLFSTTAMVLVPFFLIKRHLDL